MNIPWDNLAPFNSTEIATFAFSRFSLVLSQTHVPNPHFLQNYQVLNSDTRYRRNLNLVSGTRFRYSDAGTLRYYRIRYHHFTHGAPLAGRGHSARSCTYWQATAARDMARAATSTVEELALAAQTFVDFLAALHPPRRSETQQRRRLAGADGLPSNDAAAAVLEAAAASSDQWSRPLAFLFARLRRHVRARKTTCSGDGNVLYADDGAAAFDAFIRNGGNVSLYTTVADALERDVWPTSTPHDAPWKLLDIGCGDAANLLPGLRRRACSRRVSPAETGTAAVAVDLIEPSGPLLADAVKKLSELSPAIHHTAHQLTLQSFVNACDRRDRHVTLEWDACQSTFALQNLNPDERLTALRWLAPRCGRLALVEFDVPAALARDIGIRCAWSERWLPSLAQAELLLEAYSRGVAEYIDLGQDGELVVDSFLIPIMLGYFEPADGGAATFEQPARAWATTLRRAGFSQVTARPLCPYWWAEAWLIQGVGRRTDGDARM
eukprot:SAG31_NODE_5277_length_2636_cov_11.564899_2_plen_494_part_00